MFYTAHYENSRAGGVGILEIVAEGPQAPRRFVPLQRSELCGEVIGPLAALTLRQTFAYRREELAATVEACYRFPLPGDAAVMAVRVHFGDVEIATELKARDLAEAAYAQAKQEGRQAVLATREAADVFTLQVSGLQPEQPVVVETSYVQLAHAESSGWSLRIPLTTAPRYVRADERQAPQANGQPLVLLRDPGHRFALDLHFQGVEQITSPTHELLVTDTAQAEPKRIRVQLAQGEVIPDRDCVLHWRARRQAAAPTLTIFTYAEPAASDDRRQDLYFLAQIAPPRQPAQAAIPREAILLVDHSGSMQGAKWTAADWAVDRFLSDLKEGDRFALASFHTETAWFVQDVAPATADRVTEAVAWLQGRRDSGGTNLGVALEQALRLPRKPGASARHVLLLTDAAVSDEARILRLADAERTQAARRRINILCIDAAPNAFLALELAKRGGGVAKFLTSDPAEEDITTALDEVLADWAEPFYADLQLRINQPHGIASEQQTLAAAPTGATWIDVGALTGGGAQWIAGYLPQVTDEQVSFTLSTAANAALATTTLDRVQAEKGTAGAAVKALFGARRIMALEYLINAGFTQEQLAEQLARLGYQAEEILHPNADNGAALYPENVRSESQRMLQELLVQESLRYHLASTAVAFVATRQEAGEPVTAQVAVANALPVGWSDQFLLHGGYGSAPPGMTALRSMSMPAQPVARMRAAEGPSDAPLRAVSPAPALSPAPMSPASFGPGPASQEEERVIFTGKAPLSDGRAELFNSDRQAVLPDAIILRALQIELPDTASFPTELPPSITLALFVGDLASPRARLSLRDLFRRQERPLNIERKAGAMVQVVLLDPDGVWGKSAVPPFTLKLRWVVSGE
ncbi:MAG: VIT domain-containing protein [Caldilineaceae bacterium]